jgi:hypothetical protein
MSAHTVEQQKQLSVKAFPLPPSQAAEYKKIFQDIKAAQAILGVKRSYATSIRLKDTVTGSDLDKTVTSLTRKGTSLSLKKARDVKEFIRPLPSRRECELALPLRDRDFFRKTALPRPPVGFLSSLFFNHVGKCRPRLVGILLESSLEKAFAPLASFQRNSCNCKSWDIDSSNLRMLDYLLEKEWNEVKINDEQRWRVLRVIFRYSLRTFKLTVVYHGQLYNLPPKPPVLDVEEGLQDGKE